MANEVKEHLELMSAMLKDHHPPIGDYFSLFEFVLRNGHHYQSQPLPKRYKRGPAQQCFYNAAKLAKKHKLIYVEGYALSIIPTAHAWCVLPYSNMVIDNTWEDGIDYFGVPFKLDYVLQTHKKSKQYSLIDNWEQAWPVLTDNKDLWYDTRTFEEPVKSLS